MITNKRLFLPLGFLALTLSVFLGKVGPDLFPHMAFFEGLLLGFATVLAVAGLVTEGRAADNE